ncbi:T-complex protein 1 subunit zeta [Sphaceloma murrayae]|uniref:T-complex protein 1 subunit zeta n=1 Tax=Sphaceloma murrayae TaxID=2082308 RepID=A0A2K1R249_9PEZI|nr:T-complex protein 1 subunit zeta [Sphaceloma murrayae]
MSDSLTVTVCGDGGCGKSSLTLRVVRGAWTHDYDPTIEDSYTVSRTVDGQPFSLHLTDTAGQEEYRSMFSAQNVHADAFLLVYSITSRQSLEMLEVWERMVEDECENRREAGRVWPGIMVVGNKCDLGQEREVSSREGLEWARKRGYGFMETSARECVNVEETFSALVRRVVEARKMHAQGLTQPSSPLPGKHTMDGGSYDEKTSPSLKQGPNGGYGQDQPKKKGFWSKLSCF